LSNVSAGSYTVTVSDANGCTFATTVNIPDQVGPVVNIATSNQVTCNGGNDGSVSVGIVGGNNPFNYVWSNGASSASEFKFNGWKLHRNYYRCLRMYINVSSQHH
jgi:uncharacterized membrane protein